MVFNGVWVGLGHEGARSHRKDRASTGLFLFIRNLGLEWALGKMVYRGHGICEKYPFDLPPSTPPPPPTLSITTAHPRSAQSTNIRFQADTKNKMTRYTRGTKHLDESRTDGMIAMEADGLIPAISRRSFRLARLGPCPKSCPLHHIISHPNPQPLSTTIVLAGLAWRDSIFVVLVYSLHLTQTF